MPKLKTHRGAAKRFKMTATGKIKRSKAYKSHILTKKTTKRKRGLDMPSMVSKADQKRVEAMLPYGSILRTRPRSASDTRPGMSRARFRFVVFFARMWLL